MKPSPELLEGSYGTPKKVLPWCFFGYLSDGVNSLPPAVDRLEGLLLGAQAPVQRLQLAPLALGLTSAIDRSVSVDGSNGARLT